MQQQAGHHDFAENAADSAGHTAEESALGESEEVEYRQQAALPEMRLEEAQKNPAPHDEDRRQQQQRVLQGK